MKKVLCIVLLSISFLACSNENVENETKKFVAKQYEAFIKGDYETYIQGFDISKNATKQYQTQLIANTKMYAKLINKEHKGIQSFEIKSVTVEENNKEANVFIEVLFKDSLKETMIIPVIKRDEEWKLR